MLARAVGLQMPLYWVIDSRERLVTGVAEGGVRKEDVDAYLDAIAGAGAGTYRKLFDGSRGEPLMSADDIMAVAVRMRGMQEAGLAGPLAMVMPRVSASPARADWPESAVTRPILTVSAA